MHSKNSPITSITFTETELILAVVYPATGKIDGLHRFTYGFNGLKTSGAIDNPVKMREFLEDLYVRYNFPTKTVVGIGLKYLDFKRMRLPLMPADELQQIITDEATRESIFSFSNDPIAVAYSLAGHSGQPSSQNYDILAATTFKEVINSYRATFESKAIQLLAVKPLLDGFRTTLAPIISHNGESSAFIKLNRREAEFYIWQKEFPLFWRSLMVGGDDSERLQTEILTSLEHFKRRTTEQYFIDKLFVIGEKTPIQLDGVETHYLEQTAYDDLAGLGVGFEQNSTFNFVKSSDHPSLGSKIQSFSYGLAILGLLGINLWLAADARTEWARIKSLEQNLAANQKQITTQNTATISHIPQQMDWPLFLEELRRNVPSNLRFEIVEFGLEHNEMTIEGFCAGQPDLNLFLKRLAGLDHVKTVTLIDTTLQEHSGLSILQFKMLIRTGADNE